MQRLIVIACLTALAAATPVFAQENANEADEPMPDPAVCLIGEYADLPEADATTAAFLVCRHLRNQGVQVGEPVYDAPDTATVYRVSLRILGQYILVHLAQETPVGTVVEERELLLASIEEMVSAAPRLVGALVNQTSLAATVDMENLVEEEAREYRKVPGEFMWRLGILQAFALVSGSDAIARPGGELGWLYETPSYAVGTGLRLAGGSNDKGGRFSFFAWSVGAQYFFHNRNISPYAGGGLAMSWGSHREAGGLYGYGSRYSDNGVGLYVVGGMEAFRLSRARLNVELRIDLPFYKVGDRTMIPVSLGATVSL